MKPRIQDFLFDPEDRWILGLPGLTVVRAYGNKGRRHYAPWVLVQRVTIDGRRTRRGVLQKIISVPPGKIVDHIDGNTLDNRKSNLRLATRAQNAMNKGPSRNNTSGYKGVCWQKKTGRWQAAIQVQGKAIYLGAYDTPQEAHAAYCEAARRHFGEFARVA